MDVEPRVRIALSPSPPDGGRRGANKKCREKRGAPMAAPLRRFCTSPAEFEARQASERKGAARRMGTLALLRQRAKIAGRDVLGGGGEKRFF